MMLARDSNTVYIMVGYAPAGTKVYYGGFVVQYASNDIPLYIPIHPSIRFVRTSVPHKVVSVGPTLKDKYSLSKSLMHQHVVLWLTDSPDLLPVQLPWDYNWLEAYM